MQPIARWIDARPVVSVSAIGQGTPLGDWLVAGPFRHDLGGTGGLYREIYIGRADFVDADFLGDESLARPREGDAVRNDMAPGGFVRWERLFGAERYDLAERFPDVSTGLAYAATWLATDAPVDIILRALATFGGRRSVVALFLDGVAVGRGDEPAYLRLPAGEHCLLVKIAGGGRRLAWRIAVEAGVVAPFDGPLGIAFVALPGYWRGPEESPSVEAEAVVVNRGSSPVSLAGMTARLSGGAHGNLLNGAGDVPLPPSRARAVRIAAPLGARKPGDRVTVAVVRNGAELCVEAIVPPLAESGILHVLEGFHCDPVWVSDQHHYNLVSLDNVRQLLDGCLADPRYRVFVHEIDYLKPFADEYPDYRAALFALVREGRVNLGSSYNEPNENNCSGEAIVRNILYGRGFHRHFLGGEPGVYHAWDVFGHCPQLTQIVAKSGLIGVLWSKHILGNPPVFRNMALDGTVLPTLRFSYSWGSNSLDHLRDNTAVFLAEDRTLGHRRHLVVDAGDFKTPTAWMVGRTADMAQSFPQIVMTGPEEFVHGLTDDGSRVLLQSRNESQYHVGTFHSRSELKIANRLAENALYAAEVWATFASLMGARYPDMALDKAWRQVLFNEHHDALSGTPCDVSYLDLLAGYREALELAGEVVRNATRFVARGVEKPAEGRAMVAFNPLAWARDGVVSLPLPEGAASIAAASADGTALPVAIEGGRAVIRARDIPSAGYATIVVSPSNEAPRSRTLDRPVLENEFWRIELDPARGGGIARLVDKASGRDLIDASGGVANDLVAMRELGRRGAASWEFWTTGEHAKASDGPATVTVEETPVGIRATIAGKLAEICTYRRTLVLRPGQRTIEASVMLDGYAGEDDLFAVTATPAIAGALPVYEDRFGTIVGRRGKKAFDYRTGGHLRPSDCAIFPVYNWIEAGWSARAVVGDGDSALNLGMAGAVLPHDERVGDMLAPFYAALASAGIQVTPYFDDDDAARHALLDEKYAGEPRHDTRLPRTEDLGLCAEWIAIDVAGNNGYVRDLLGRLPAKAGETLDAGIRESGWAMIVAEHDAVPAGWPAQPVLVLAARDHDALGRAFDAIGASLRADGIVRLPAGADFRQTPGTVDDAGFALLTTGTGAGTMEPDGTLTIFLTHTSLWAEYLLPEPFTPEHRRMVFHYGYLPHAGSWREGGVVRAGYELNNPLSVAIAEGKGGILPASASFLSFDAPGAVVTAIKPAGYPVARFESRASDPRQGIVVRAYDATGRGTHGTLSLRGGVREAVATNLMEDERGALALAENAVPWEIAPFAVETVRLAPDAGAWPVIGDGALGRERESVQPVWCRYWKHNAGAAPFGFLPVGIYLDGDLPIENAGGNFPTVARLRVTIVNNYTDREIDGEAHVVGPDAWTFLPATIPYRLAPREHAVRTVTVAYDHAHRTGLVKARLAHDGTVYQDVIEAGRKTERRVAGEGTERLNGMDIVRERPLEWQVLRDGQDIVVRVRNPWWEPVDAELSIVAPPEMWGDAVGAFAVADVSPRHVGLAIPGRQGATARFRIGRDAKGVVPALWAWAKLAYHGGAEYRHVPGTTR